jgi:hypothetical protein
MLELDGGLQLLMRESEVPADVQGYLAHKKEEEIQRVRRRMKDEGFAPSTVPATQPTANEKEKDL